MIEIFARLYKILLTHMNSFHIGKERERTYKYNNNCSSDDSSPIPTGTDLAQYYACLEIPYGADLKDVKAAWKRMMKKYHPDLHSKDPERYTTATILTQELTKAYKEIEKAHQNNKETQS